MMIRPILTMWRIRFLSSHETPLTLIATSRSNREIRRSIGAINPSAVDENVETTEDVDGPATARVLLLPHQRCVSPNCQGLFFPCRFFQISHPRQLLGELVSGCPYRGRETFGDGRSCRPREPPATEK